MTSISAVQVERLRTDFGELVARHKQTRDLKSLAKYRDDPVGFITQELKGEPWERQTAIAEMVCKHRFVVVATAN